MAFTARLVVTYDTLVMAKYKLVVHGDNNTVAYFYDTAKDILAYAQAARKAGYKVELDIRALNAEDKATFR